MPKFNSYQKQFAVDYHLANSSNSLEHNSMTLGIGRATLTRWLADAGVHDLPSHKTKEDKKMLKYLETKGITDLATLKKNI